MKLSELLKQLLATPEDLSTLPQAVELAQTMETQDQTQIEQIGKLQENYRKVLQMVPIPGNEPPEKKEDAVPEATPEQAVSEMLEEMKNY